MAALFNAVVLDFSAADVEGHDLGIQFCHKNSGSSCIGRAVGQSLGRPGRTEALIERRFLVGALRIGTKTGKVISNAVQAGQPNVFT